MDNASKALIIAGAVLIAVMLVSVGVMIYQQAVGVIDESGKKIDAMTASVFNGDYEQYLDKDLSKSSCKQLIDKLIQNNRNSEDHFIFFNTNVRVDNLAAARAVAAPGVNTTNTMTDDRMNAILNSVSGSKNIRFYCKSHKDSYGYIDSILIIPMGEAGATWTVPA